MIQDNSIIQGDCLEIMKQIPDKSIDLVLTDPPYCVGTTSNGKKASWLDNNLVLPFFNIFLQETERVLKDTGEFYIHTDWRTYPFLFYPISKYLVIKNLIVWDYGWIKAGSHYRFTHEFIIYGLKNRETKRKFSASESDVWREKPMNFTLKDKRHNAEKPEELAIRMINNSSAIGDLIIDPFAGSGTTCVAAKMLGRRYIGIEISPEYCKIAEQRIANTGIQAEMNLCKP